MHIMYSHYLNLKLRRRIGNYKSLEYNMVLIIWQVFESRAG